MMRNFLLTSSAPGESTPFDKGSRTTWLTYPGEEKVKQEDTACSQPHGRDQPKASGMLISSEAVEFDYCRAGVQPVEAHGEEG
jgi:hypothetical protein